MKKLLVFDIILGQQCRLKFQALQLYSSLFSSAQCTILANQKTKLKNSISHLAQMHYSQGQTQKLHFSSWAFPSCRLEFHR